MPHKESRLGSLDPRRSSCWRGNSTCPSRTETHRPWGLRPRRGSKPALFVPPMRVLPYRQCPRCHCLCRNRCQCHCLCRCHCRPCCCSSPHCCCCCHGGATECSTDDTRYTLHPPERCSCFLQSSTWHRRTWIHRLDGLAEHRDNKHRPESPWKPHHCPSRCCCRCCWFG